MTKLFKILLILVAFGLWLYYFYPQFIEVYTYKRFEYKICTEPLGYYVEPIDTRFGLTQKELESAIEKASLMWELEANKDLFVRTNKKDADFIIRAVFDSRQAVTIELDSLNSKLDNGLAQIELQKNKLESDKNSFAASQNNLMARISRYESEVTEYDNKISRYNPASDSLGIQYQEITRQKELLDDEKKEIEKENIKLNNQSNEVKETVNSVNSEVTSFNTVVADYNNKNIVRGREFREGEYIVNKNKREIVLYEFESLTKLQRLLAHELGHVLELDHVENTNSIMNAYNTSDNMSLTREDKIELKISCGKQI